MPIDPSLRPQVEHGATTATTHINGRRAGQPIHAIVMAASIETPYLAVGNGRPVVLLRARGGPEPFWAQLMEGLAADARVLAPEPPAIQTAVGLPAGPSGQPAFSAWLRAFLDGLGLHGVGLIASAAFGTAALAFTLFESERVERIVLVHDDWADPAAPSESYADRLDGAGQPLLLVRVCHGSAHEPAESCAGRLIASVADFMRG